MPSSLPHRTANRLPRLSQGALAPRDLAESHRRAELLIVAPVRQAIGGPFDERPDDGVVGVAGEDEPVVDPADGADRPSKLIDGLEQDPPRTVSAVLRHPAGSAGEARHLPVPEDEAADDALFAALAHGDRV